MVEVRKLDPPEVTYLTPEEVSARFRGKVAIRTLANWRTKGEGPRWVKVGGRILYPLHEVEAYEGRRTADCTSDYGK